MDPRVSSRRLFGPIQLTNAAASVYAPTLVSNSKAAITMLWACNLDAGGHALTLHLVPTGGTAVAANILVPAKAIAAKDTLVYGGFESPMLILNRGDTIWAFADANTVVNLMGIGWEG